MNLGPVSLAANGKRILGQAKRNQIAPQAQGLILINARQITIFPLRVLYGFHEELF